MKNTPPIPLMPRSVLRQVTGLSSLPMPEMKVLWRKLYKTEAPTHNRPFLERRLAYKIQEAELSRNNLPLLKRNEQRIAALIKTGKMAARYTNAQARAGTLFEREYKGCLHKVYATADGQYDYNGQAFRSLSVIAREITGTRWSGPAFFGVKARAA
jgi:Protein of unknown function (DUF2924)